jgi:hypothetical protein
MKQLSRLRPTPAMVVACIALTVALGGTSVAAINALPRNSVGAKQLKKNAVTNPKIKANAVTGAKVANNSITGADVNEASLGAVPSATSATNATNAASAANADKLDNLDSTAFLGLGDARADGTASSTDIDNFVTTTYTNISSVSLTAPKAGFVFIVGTLSSEDDNSFAGAGSLFYRLAVDGTGLSNDLFYHQIASDETTGITGASGAASAVVAVAAGAHTVSLQARESGTGDFILGRDISVIFVPTGSGSTPPFGPFGHAQSAASPQAR